MLSKLIRQKVEEGFGKTVLLHRPTLTGAYKTTGKMADNKTTSNDTRPRALLYKTDLSVEEIVPANRRYFKLAEIQRYVGGLIQIIPLEGGGQEDKLLVVNEEGKNINLPFNLFATIEWIKYYGETDFVSGHAIICHPSLIR